MTSGKTSSPRRRRRAPAGANQDTQGQRPPAERTKEARPDETSAAAAEPESPSGSVAVDQKEAHLGATEAGG